MAFHFAEQATQDLYAIYENGKREFGERTAELYYMLFLDAAELASRHPLASPIRDYLSMEVRVRYYGSHAMVYRFDDPDIVILRVLHQSQDWLDQI